jgi:hypothetical protein
VAENGRDVTADDAHDEVGTGVGVQPRQPCGQTGRTAVRRRPPPGAPGQAAQRRGQLVGRHTGDVEVGRHHLGSIEPPGGVEQRQAALGRQRTHAAQPGQVGGGQPGGHAAGARPQAPGHGHAREAEAAAMGHQRVTERVGRRVTRLPGAADDAGGRGEDPEGPQRHVPGQDVEVPGAQGLGPPHALQAFRIVGGENRVVEHPGRVDHRGERMLGRDARERPCQRFPVGDVGRRHVDVRARGGQPFAELRHAGRGRASPRQQQQTAHAVPPDEVLGHQPAEHAGSAGHQEGPVRVGRRLGVCVFARDRGEPGHQHLVAVHLHLFFARVERPPDGVHHHGVRHAGSGDVHEHETARMLGLGAADQSPHPGRDESAPGEEGQPDVGQLRFGQPRLGCLEHAFRRGPRVVGGVTMLGPADLGERHGTGWRPGSAHCRGQLRVRRLRPQDSDAFRIGPGWE